MGQARQKLEADACGIARPRDPWCPACRSRRLTVLPRDAFPHADEWGIECDWHGCLDCKAVWEPFPAVYVRDPVCAEPCDNCAFRPGSPEQRDPERWAELMASLRQGYWQSRFYCHKGIPFDLTKGPGNYLYPEREMTFEGKTIKTPDTAKMRTCSGFLRMTWARNAKHPPPANE